MKVPLLVLLVSMLITCLRLDALHELRINKYIKEVRFKNEFNETVKLKVTFNSGKKQSLHLIPGVSVKLGRKAGEVGSEVVDPVSNFTVTVNGSSEIVNDPATKIEIRSYAVNSDGEVEQRE